MLERTIAISASAICADAVPSVRTSCSIASSPTNSRPMRNRSSNATSASPKLRSNGRGSGNPAARQTRSAKVDVDPGAFGDLRERRPGAFGPDEPQGGHAEQAVLLDGLHDLRDRRADLLGEEAQHARGARPRPRPPGRRARQRRSRRDVHRVYRERPGVVDRSLPRAARVPSRATAPAARRARPRRRRAADHCGSSAGARSSIPAGRVPQQRRPRAVPAHGERERARRAAGGRARRASAEPLGRELREQVDAVAGLGDEHLPHREQELGRRRRRVERAYVGPRRDRRRRRAARRARQPRRDHAAAASASKPQSSSAANDRPVPRRREQQVGARRVDVAPPRLRQLGAHASVELALPAALDGVRIGERADVELARRPSAVRSTRAVRHGHEHRDLDRRVPRRRLATRPPARTRTDLACVGPAAQSRGGRASVSTRRAVDDDSTLPSSRDRPRAVDPEERSRSSTAPATRSRSRRRSRRIRTASRRRTRVARPRRSAPAPRSRSSARRRAAGRAWSCRRPARASRRRRRPTSRASTSPS